jgi:DNA-binding transcriptional MerR regulator
MPNPAESAASAVSEGRARGAEDPGALVGGTRPRHAARSIGQVMAILRTEFPDISISKIRFLEAEGLITPQRAPSGYRRYTENDVERLRYVLAVQRDHYLPLKVIREHLEQLDRGQAQFTTGAQSALAGIGGQSAERPASPSATAAKQPVRLTRQELLDASGLTESALSELERTQILTTRRGTAHYGRDALTLAIAARRLAEYGLDGRHLRAFKLSADREVGLVEQVIAPYIRRTGGNRDVPGDVTQLVISFHAALVRTAMERNI